MAFSLAWCDATLLKRSSCVLTAKFSILKRVCNNSEWFIDFGCTIVYHTNKNNINDNNKPSLCRQVRIAFGLNIMFKGTIMKIGKVLINDRLRVSEVSWRFSIPIIYNSAVTDRWNLIFSSKAAYFLTVSVVFFCL